MENLLIFFAIGYFVPSVIAWTRGVLTVGFFIANLLFGITGIGYIILFIMALTKEKKGDKQK